MKTTDPRDPLDQTIDSLLKGRPAQPNPDFTERVMAAYDTEVSNSASTKTRPSNRSTPILKFALPIAAIAAFALTLGQLNVLETGPAAAPTANLTAAEAQEIFILEEGLNALSLLESDSFNSTDLLSTLDALTFELKS
ncbi:MAG: hypothetical protein ACON4O_02910 [Lentimonas sp.]